MNLLHAHELSVVHEGRAVVDGVSLAVEPGEHLAIMGPSGSGKTSLLHCLAGLRVPTRGTVLLDGHEFSAASERARARRRLESVGLVFQNATLVPELSLLDNVSLPAELLGRGRSEARRRAGQLLARLGLDGQVNRQPARVSGGERQRAAIARALVTDPLVVLADEPTGMLDTHSRDVVLGLLASTTHETGAALVVVTHDHVVASAADRVVQLQDGHIRADGPGAAALAAAPGLL